MSPMPKVDLDESEYEAEERLIDRETAGVPTDPKERRAYLEKAGVDVEGGLRKAMNLIRADRYRLEYAVATHLRALWLAKLAQADGTLPKRSREESVARIEELSRSSRAVAEVMEEYQDYASMNEAKLNVVVATLERLAEDEKSS